MYIDIVPNRNSPPAVLLRESWREGKQTKKRTVANLSGLPMEAVEVLRQALRGVKLAPVDERFRIVRALPYGHVAAVLGTAQRIGVPEVLASRPSRERALALAMIVARILDGGPARAAVVLPDPTTDSAGSRRRPCSGGVDRRRSRPPDRWRSSRSESHDPSPHMGERDLLLAEERAEAVVRADAARVRATHLRGGEAGSEGAPL